MPALIIRYVFSIIISLIVVFGLFWLMQYLIVSADRKLDDDEIGQMLDFVRVQPEEIVNRHKPPPE